MKKTKTINIDAEESSAIVRHDQSRDLAETLSREISQAFTEFQDSANDVLDLALSIENKRIKLGVLLNSAKAQLRHGEFVNFVETNLPFTIRSAQRFMKHADAADGRELTSIEGLKVYNSILIEWGLREEPSGHGPQVLHDAPSLFGSATKSLGSARKSLTELLENRPLTDWNDDEKSQLKSQLEPVVSVYNLL